MSLRNIVATVERVHLDGLERPDDINGEGGFYDLAMDIVQDSELAQEVCDALWTIYEFGRYE